MSEAFSLKQAESKAFKIATQDGMWDILIGCIFLIFAFAPYLSTKMGDFWSSIVFIPFWGLVALGIKLVRKYIIKPRIGVVKFGAARKVKLRKFTLVMLIINIIVFSFGSWLAFNSGILSGQVTSAFFGFICLVLMSIAAYFLDFWRLYIYGLLGGVSPLVGEWLYVNHNASHHGFPITFGITSGIMILTGMVVFIQLLLNNPVNDKGNKSKEF
jgi:hypothetical protein